MRPYDNNIKFKLRRASVPGTSKGISKTHKLEIKNANRSLKKAIRQASKREINLEL